MGVEYDVMHNENDNDDNNDDNDNDNGNGMEGSSRRGSAGEFGGWVWDLPPLPGSGGRDEEVWLAYGEGGYDFPAKEKEKVKKMKAEKVKDWEEATRYGNSGRTGEWRRRRWVRVVRRRYIDQHTL